MSPFRYVAARSDGARVRGQLDADSVDEASGILSERGLYPLRIRWMDPSPTLTLRRPGSEALATVMQSVASLVEVGVPVHRALEATGEVTEGFLRDVLMRVQHRVREGTSLATAMDEEHGVFPPVTIGLIRAGEGGVGLASALMQASRQLEREAEIRAKVRTALSYPIILIVVGMLSVAAIVWFVLPRFAALLVDVGAALPPATRALLWASALFREHGSMLAIGGLAMIAVVAGIARRYAEEAARLALDAPGVGAVRHALATARASRALSALIGTGVSALPALAVAQDAAGDAGVRARLATAGARVAEGARLADAVAGARALTPRAIQLIRIGEQSGRLAELLERAADLEEQFAMRRIKALVTILEPLLIVLFGAAVAFVAGALLQGIYSVRPGGQ